MSTLEKKDGPFEAAWLSEVGGREVNQDCYGSLGAEKVGVRCWVVADGLGGHRGGEIASALATEAIVEYFKRYQVFSTEAIEHSFELAQQAILKKQAEEPDLYSMRTTAVVLLIDGDRALWGHVGDSRLYHFRKGQKLFQTSDHSVTQAFHDAGHISTQQMRTDINRSRLIKVLGKDEAVDPKVQKKPVQLTPEDTLLLCTDGFWEPVDEDSMEEDLGQTWMNSPQEWIDRMEARLRRTVQDEFDNYTAYAIFFRPQPGIFAAAVPAKPKTGTSVRGYGSVPSRKGKALATFGLLLVSLLVLAYFLVPAEKVPWAPAGPNQPPTANDDTAQTEAGTLVPIQVLENDVDPDGDKLILAAVGSAEHGEVDWQGEIIEYTPNQGFSGRDYFTYRVTDGRVLATGSVEVRVRALPGSITAPDAQDDEATTGAETPVPIAVLKNDFDADGDELVISELGQPSNGTVREEPDGSVTYTPDRDFEGKDEFRYQVSDGELTAWAVVKVKVEAPNQPPVAHDDSASAEAGKPETIHVLDNDTDAENQPLRVVRIEASIGGTPEISDDEKTVVFTPTAGFSGEASFIYVISDGAAEAKATVRIIQVAAPPPPSRPSENQPPKPELDEVSTIGLRLAIKVLENDKDPEGQELTLKSVTQPTHGTAKAQGAVVTYQRDPEFKGADQFTYVVSDGQKEATGTVKIQVFDVLKPGFVTQSSHGLAYVWVPADEEKSIGPLWLGKTEVTMDAYKRFMNAQNQQMPSQGAAPSGETYPVIEVSWSDAKNFCGWSGGRLPTKEEWQHAASEGKAQDVPWGDSELSCEQGATNGANYKRCNKGSAIPVSSFEGNAFSLHDMIGNVWEWCDGQMVLGGGFKTRKGSLGKVKQEQDRALPDVGFRCARDNAP